MFTPINKHVEVEPIKEESITYTPGSNFEAKGKVISFDEDDCEREWGVGTVVFFDPWLVAKFTDSQGKERWLVPEDAIRAYESSEE